MMIYTGEVGNGGHLQYFANSSGALAAETVEALLELQEAQLAQALQDAVALFPNALVPKDRSNRVEAIKGMDDEQFGRFDDLDQVVWARITSVDERALLYLQAHFDDVLTKERS